MSVARTVAKVGVGLAAAGVGAAVGIAAERMAAGRALGREDAGAGEDGSGPALGTLRGHSLTVLADDGTALHVEIDELDGVDALDRGDRRDAPTVVFTHGFALNLDAWHFQRLALRGHFRLVLWDQRGHGRSAAGPRGRSTIETIGRDLARVLEQAAPDGPLVLVGHSMGGMTIMSFAGEHPHVVRERVDAVALIATSAGGLADVPWMRGERLSKLAHRFAPGAASALALRPELVSRTRRLGSDLEQILVRRYSFASPVPAALVRYAAEMIAATPIDVVADYLPTFDRHDARAALRSLAETEVLILGGADDAMTPPEHSDELAALLPQAEHVVVADAGHLVMLEHPEVVDQALFRLIDRARSRAGGRRGRRGQRRTVVGLGAARRRRRAEPA